MHVADRRDDSFLVFRWGRGWFGGGCFGRHTPILAGRAAESNALDISAPCYIYLSRLTDYRVKVDVSRLVGVAAHDVIEFLTHRGWEKSPIDDGC
jgi:hypothetical protein